MRPARLCCGQPHDGVVCPDGLVMCCICFDRFTTGELFVDTRGQTWDMCGPCGREDERAS